MLSVLKRKISARKKKKESVWRDPRTSSSLVVAFASVLLLLLLAPLGQVEASGTELVHLFGGAQFDKAKCVIEHSIDTGLVIAGQTLSFWAERPSGYNDDMFLVKTDSVGVALWAKTYGGTSTDVAQCVIEHSIDNGFVVAGEIRQLQ
jgi:hypothetical protein